MKDKMMNFADGLKAITIGMEVAYGNGQGGRHFHLYKSKVKTIGHKLVTLENGDKFYLEDGRMQTQYASGLLYSSKEAYDKDCLEQKIISNVCARIRDIGYKMTFDQAVKIAEIMDISVEELKNENSY